MRTPSSLSGQLLLRLFSFLKPHRSYFMVAMLALVVGSALNLALPELARRALSDEMLPRVSGNLAIWMSSVAALFCLQGVTGFIRSYFFNVIGQRVYSTVRAQLFSAIMSKNITFFDSHPPGELATRINSDAALIQDAVSVKASVLIRYAIQVVFGIILMVWMSWRLATAIVGALVVVLLVSTLCASRLREAAREYQSQLARLAAFATEVFGSARVVHSLGAQQDVQQRFDEGNRRTLVAGVLRGKIGAGFASGASLLLNLLLVGVAWYGISLLLAGRLGQNDLVAFVLYGGIVAASSAFLVGAYADIMQSAGGLQRVFELLGEESPLTRVSAGRGASPGEDRGAQPRRGRGIVVKVRQVSFAYGEEEDGGILTDISFDLEPGRISALVGPSGAGKSSLVQLLLRFFLPQQGEITFDGVPLGKLSEGHLRSVTAWVPHDPPLFTLSVLENLLIGNSDLEPQEAARVVSSWPFMDFISDFPEGIATTLGHKGFQVSTGQRQRIAIARALLRRPELLILDEATSGLDPATEQGVFETLAEWLPHATVLLISHRTATVRGAHTAFVLHEGRLSEQGEPRYLQYLRLNQREQ